MTCAFDLTGPYAYDLSVQVLWVPSIANAQAPTAAEIATGVDIQAVYNLTDIVGWEIETNILTDGQWGPFELERLGKQNIGDTRLLCAADRGGADIRSLLSRGQDSFVVILSSGPYLDHPTAPVNVYPVTVAQLTQQQQLRTGGGSLIRVDFAVRARCGENVLVTP